MTGRRFRCYHQSGQAVDNDENVLHSPTILEQQRSEYPCLPASQNGFAPESSQAPPQPTFPDMGFHDMLKRHSSGRSTSRLSFRRASSHKSATTSQSSIPSITPTTPTRLHPKKPIPDSPDDLHTSAIPAPQPLTPDAKTEPSRSPPPLALLQSQHEGSGVSFSLPADWKATHIDDSGFHLQSGNCSGYVRCVRTLEVPSALCDTSTLDVLCASSYSTWTSPYPNRGGEILMAEIRGAAGKVVALMRGEHNGFVAVFGVAGPQKCRAAIEMAEKALMTTLAVDPTWTGGMKQEAAPDDSAQMNDSAGSDKDGNETLPSHEELEVTDYSGISYHWLSWLFSWLR